MDSFPVFLKLSGRPVLVVGGSEAALSKTRLLASAGATVKVVSPVFVDGFRAIAAGGLRIGHVQARDFDGVDLVIIATGAEKDDRRAAEEARRAGKLVNVVDRPALCDFAMPAVVDRGTVVVAISTDGASPVLAQRVRALIEGVLPPRLGRLADFAKRFRSSVAARISAHDHRREFWTRVIDGPIAQQVLSGDEAGAARAIMRELNQREIRHEAGRVWFVGAMAGDAESLTLKAARILRMADVVVYDRGLDPSFFEYARRDARRIELTFDNGRSGRGLRQAAAILSEHALTGRRVVRLHGIDFADLSEIAGEASHLGKAGIVHEAVPFVAREPVRVSHAHEALARTGD